MRPELIIFDCDGVLVDSEPIALRVLLESVTKAGLNLPAGVAAARFLGLSLQSTQTILADEFGVRLNEDDLARMRRGLYAAFETELKPTIGVAEALDEISLPRCVASSSQLERIALSLKVAGLHARLEPHIFSASMVARGKPAPDLFLHAATAMGAEPGRCVVVEDSPFGVQAARRAGMRAFGYVGGSHARAPDHANALRAAGASVVFDEMTDLPKLVDSLSIRRARSADEPLVIGVDVGTRSARAGLFNTAGELLEYAKRPISLRRPRPETGEQDSEEIWRAVCASVRETMEASGANPDQVRGLGIDATTSLVARGADGAQISISETGEPRWDVISWMDHRAVEEAREATAANDADRGRAGTVISVEMQTPKAMWLKRRLPETWARAAQLFDLADFLTWRATGQAARSAGTLGAKWPYETHGAAGWRRGYLAALGMEDIVEKCGRSGPVIPVGGAVGSLSGIAAEELDLDRDCIVAAGMVDAHAGMLGAMSKDALERGAPAAALIAGTSACIMTLTPDPAHIPGVWGPHYSVVAPGFWTNELGQSASGSLLDHIIDWHSAGGTPNSAEHIRIADRILELRESEGLDIAPDLHVAPDFHGDRSDPSAPLGLGMICGLTLDSSFDSLCRLYWRTAVGLALGLGEVCVRMQNGGLPTDWFYAAGGHSQSRLLIELYAASLNAPIEISEAEHPVLLGSAMSGAAAAGLFPDLDAARRRMAQPIQVIRPRTDLRDLLDKDRAVLRKMTSARKGLIV